MGSTLCPKWFLKTRFFVKKLKISCSLDHTVLIKFHYHVVQIFFLSNVWRDFRLLMSALATVALRVFFARAFYFTIADADIESLNSLHTLFDKYLDHMLVKFEQNRMITTIQNFEPFDKNV